MGAVAGGFDYLFLLKYAMLAAIFIFYSYYIISYFASKWCIYN